VGVRAREAVRDHSRAKGAARNILYELADRAKDDGIAWPDQVRLAREANVHVRTVRRQLQKLAAAGEIETRVERGGRRRHAYRLTLPGLDAPNPNPNPERPPWELEEPWNVSGHSARGHSTRGQVVPIVPGQRGRSARARSSQEPKEDQNRKSGSPKSTTGGLSDARFADYD
jgi:hypothetical protein